MSGIRQLAKHLDISIGTVSRALNNKPDVKKETRDRVLRAAIELGYRPNQSGRALRTGSTRTIGFVLETGNASTLGGDNFFMELVDSAQEVLGAAGFDLVLLPCRSADDPIEFLQRQVARGVVDALVISATRRQDSRISFLVGQGTPFLTLGRSETPGDYPWIDLDFAGVARDAVARLVALGHSRIAVAAPRRDVNLAHVFINGYRRAMIEQGLGADPALVFRASSDENGGMFVANRFLEMPDRPTAVVLGHELMAIGLYNGLAAAGLQVGRDLSVIGFRHNPQLRFLSPKLACYGLTITDLGRRLAEAVLDLVLPGKPAAPCRIIWKMGFIEGESVQPPPPV